MRHDLSMCHKKVTAARALDTGGNGLKDFRKTRRKRIEAWLTAAMFLFGTLTGCGSVSDTHGDVGTPNNGKLKVVTTLFPYYDFTRQIAGGCRGSFHGDPGGTGQPFL